ncbi:MAG: DUF2214 family protein [Bacteroidota bacterium]
MSTELLLRYLHFLSILAIAGTLTAEAILVKERMTRKTIGTVARIDLYYGIAAITLLAAGLTLWLTGIGKPAEWYTRNWIFHLKLTLFVAIGLLSIYPTVFFLKKRKGDPDEEVPVPILIRYSIYTELLLLAVIPMLAGLMARGIGLPA